MTTRTRAGGANPAGPQPGDTTMYTVKLTGGEVVRVGFGLLVQLRMLMDWQLVECGYEPGSVNAAWRAAEDKLAA